jgi:PAS domain S-box-containing protein
METSLTESEGERLQSEMTQLRQLLHDSEALTRLLVDASHDAVITMDAHGRVTGWNPQAEVMFGWSREEVQGECLSDFIVPPQHRAAHERGLQRFLTTGLGPVLNKRFEITALRRGGQEFPVELSIAPAGAGDTYVFGAFVRDLTARKQAEAALHQQTALVQLLQVVAAAANQAPSREAALQTGVDQVCAYTGWPVGHAYVLADDGTGELAPTQVWHMERAERFEQFRRITEASRLAPGIGLPGQVLAQRKALWIMDVTHDPNFPRRHAATDIGVKAGFAFPVLAGADVVAVLEFFSSEAVEPDDRLLEAMAHIGAQLGRVFERHRAAEELRQTHAALEQRFAELSHANAALQAEIAQRRRSEQALRESEQRLDLAMRVSRQNPWEADLVTRRLTHPRGMGALGLPAGSVPTDLEEFAAIIHPDDVAARAAAWDDIYSGQSTQFKAEFRMRDGSGNWVWLYSCGEVVEWDATGRPLRVIGMALNVSERKSAEDALRAAKEAAEAASRAKSEFLATVSHELRTPLSGVLGMVDLLADTELNECQRRYARVARTSADHLLSVINDILDYTRIESGKFELDRVDFIPSEVVQEAVTIVAGGAEAKGLRLTGRIEPSLDEAVSGDRNRLRQILVNLLANAIKFTERGEVEVQAALEAPAAGHLLLRCSVRDTGIGIAPDRLEQLFKPFSQLDPSTTRRYGGSGLGLAICRHLIGLMGGQIGVDSAFGQGSTFWFTAALAPAIATAAAARPALERSPAPRPMRPLHILVAEDDPANQLVTMAVLEKMGHSVRLAHNGREAVAAFEQEVFDLVLMDVQMPGMDGFQAATAIRAREASRGTRTPLVAVTAHVLKDDCERYRAWGLDSYLSKPMRRRELIRVLDELFGARATAGRAKPDNPLAPGEEETVFNRAAVLARLEGDEGILAELIQVYLRDWPRLFAELRQALAADDLAAARGKAHRLTGLARSFNAGPAADAAHRLEEAAATGALDAAHAARPEVEAQFIRLEQALRHWSGDSAAP